MATSAAWLKFFLAPIEILWAGAKQVRDNRLNFRYGFTLSQVADADGVDMLTVDANTANTSYEPTANTIPIRNGSGTLKGATITATSYTYSAPITITRYDPVRIAADLLDPVTGWSINNSREPEANAVAIEWPNEIKPPVGSSLKSITVVYTPPGAHVGLPVDQPGVALAVITDGVGVVYETPAQDNAANVGVYQAVRTLTKTFATPITIEASKRYIVNFFNENDTNALPGLKLHQPAGWTAEITTL
jgi:hypothetical protein